MTVYYLSIIHGLFNATVFILFLYQGRLGLKIRRARRAQAPPPAPAVRRHRKNGPRFMGLGLTGYLFGLGLVLVSEKGRAIVFPAHFIVGSVLALLLLSTFVVSRRIKRPDSPFRTPHFILGILILSLYVVQALLGLDILF